MAKHHGGTDHVQGQLNRGPRSPPATTAGELHGGTHLVKGQTKGPPRPRQYTFHGGTRLAMGTLAGKYK